MPCEEALIKKNSIHEITEHSRKKECLVFLNQKIRFPTAGRSAPTRKSSDLVTNQRFAQLRMSLSAPPASDEAAPSGQPAVTPRTPKSGKRLGYWRYPIMRREVSLSSAPVPLFVNFVGGLDAESGRPQPSKPKVCELVFFGVGDGGGYDLHLHPADSLFFVFSCVFRAFRVMNALIKKNPVHETELQPRKESDEFCNLQHSVITRNRKTHPITTPQ